MGTLEYSNVIWGPHLVIWGPHLEYGNVNVTS